MSKQLLLCPPTYFDVVYEINPWMHTDVPVNRQAVVTEWQHVADVYKNLGWTVDLITPDPKLPDQVFATDGALIIGDKVFLNNFRYVERRPEPMHIRAWLAAHGYTNFYQAQHFSEGGDMLRFGEKILAGYGFRSDLLAHAELGSFFDCDVVSLRAVDPYFYHLDTAVGVLSNDTVAFYPDALDAESQARLRAMTPNIIEATREEAEGFGLNLVSDGHNVITHNAAPSLLQKYQDAGFNVIPAPIGEFQKSGGGVKCMTLERYTA